MESKFTPDKRKILTDCLRCNTFRIFYNIPITPFPGKKKSRQQRLRRDSESNATPITASFLPSALLVAIRFEALAAFVFRHLQTSFLLKISHGKRVCEGSTCKPVAVV